MNKRPHNTGRSLPPGTATAFLAVWLTLWFVVPAGIAMADEPKPIEGPALNMPDPNVSVKSGDAKAPKPGVASFGAPLQIDIPGVKFSDIPFTVQDTQRSANIPWLAQYLAGVYRYAVGIGAFLAAVMMTVGGFMYLTAGADQGRTSRAKRFITDALLGLSVLLGAIVLLTVVNPNLTKLDAIVIPIAEQDAFTASLMTTTVDTIGTDGPGSMSGLGTGDYTPKTTACPFPILPESTSEDPEKDQRVQTFFALALPLVQGNTTVEKIKSAADLAAACKVSMGSCGSTVGFINIMAGMADPAKLKVNQKGHWVKGSNSKRIDAKLRKDVPGVRCKNAEQMGKMSAGEKKYWNGNLPNCQTTKKGAQALLMQKMREVHGTDYPDSWAATLKPGDTLVIYNGNDSFMASHSIIFLGWAKNGMAQVVNGAVGKNVNFRRFCITSKCGNPAPIVSISPPK